MDGAIIGALGRWHMAPILVARCLGAQVSAGRRSAARNIASVPCRCGHNCTWAHHQATGTRALGRDEWSCVKLLGPSRRAHGVDDADGLGRMRETRR